MARFDSVERFGKTSAITAIRTTLAHLRRVGFCQRKATGLGCFIDREYIEERFAAREIRRITEIPAQCSGPRSGCGVILIWTRLGRSRDF